MSKEEIVERLKGTVKQIESDIKEFEKTKDFEYLTEYNAYSIKEFLEDLANEINNMKEQ